MRLEKYTKIEGIIHCKTGLRIGGSKDSIEIGGTDQPVIRHPITDLPYIPGSSLKGKIRSLLELKYCPRVQETGRACDCGRCKVCKYFGSLRNQNLGPTRFLFRDADLTEKSRDYLIEAQQGKGVGLTEVKTEVWIDRRTGRAGGGGLRTQERVPSGTEFAFRLDIRVFDEDDEKDMIDFIEEGISLLEEDYLGGSGSRGYGQVEFRELKINGEPFELTSRR